MLFSSRPLTIRRQLLAKATSTVTVPAARSRSTGCDSRSVTSPQFVSDEQFEVFVAVRPTGRELGRLPPGDGRHGVLADREFVELPVAELHLGAVEGSPRTNPRSSANLSRAFLGSAHVHAKQGRTCRFESRGPDVSSTDRPCIRVGRFAATPARACLAADPPVVRWRSDTAH